MKRTFTREYMQSQRGCYTREQVDALPFSKAGNITLSKLFKTLPIRDFSWFLVRKCDLTLKQKRLFAVHCAELVLPIFEKQRPDDTRVRECIGATKEYLDGKISREELLKKCATAAYTAADAAYTAAAATYAAYAADAAAYKKGVREFIKTIN